MKLIPNLIGILDRTELIHVGSFHTEELYECYSMAPPARDISNTFSFPSRQILTPCQIRHCSRGTLKCLYDDAQGF